ncbi:MAG: hypothetical protein CMK92_00445 [Pseudomonas sp.]|nr:hypothetical protein [Pseudomonas sp.]
MSTTDEKKTNAVTPAPRRISAVEAMRGDFNKSYIRFFARLSKSFASSVPVRQELERAVTEVSKNRHTDALYESFTQGVRDFEVELSTKKCDYSILHACPWSSEHGLDALYKQMVDEEREGFLKAIQSLVSQVTITDSVGGLMGDFMGDVHEMIQRGKVKKEDAGKIAMEIVQKKLASNDFSKMMQQLTSSDRGIESMMKLVSVTSGTDVRDTATDEEVQKMREELQPDKLNKMVSTITEQFGNFDMSGKTPDEIRNQMHKKAMEFAQQQATKDHPCDDGPAKINLNPLLSAATAAPCDDEEDVPMLIEEVD